MEGTGVVVPTVNRSIEEVAGEAVLRPAAAALALVPVSVGEGRPVRPGPLALGRHVRSSHPEVVVPQEQSRQEVLLRLGVYRGQVGGGVQGPAGLLGGVPHLVLAHVADYPVTAAVEMRP